MINRLFYLAAASCFGLLTLANQTWAQTSGSAAANYLENDITSYFDRNIKSGEFSLFYDNEQLASIGVYGVNIDDIIWVVNNDRLSCDNFEEKSRHLSVRKFDQEIKDVRFSCRIR